MKKLPSKLAAGVRKVKEGQGGAAQVKSGTLGKPAAPAPTPARQPSVADQQNPAPTLDDPWTNLHPRRIWPD